MKIRLVMVLFGAWLLACVAERPSGRFAPPWKDYIEGSELTAAYDTSAVEWHHDTVRVRMIARAAQPLPSPDHKGTYQFMIETLDLHCASRMLRNDSMAVGNTLSDIETAYVNKNDPWVSFASMGDNLLVPLCDSLGRRRT